MGHAVVRKNVELHFGCISGNGKTMRRGQDIGHHLTRGTWTTGLRWIAFLKVWNIPSFGIGNDHTVRCLRRAHPRFSAPSGGVRSQSGRVSASLRPQRSFRGVTCTAGKRRSDRTPLGAADVPPAMPLVSRASRSKPSLELRRLPFWMVRPSWSGGGRGCICGSVGTVDAKHEAEAV